MKSPTMNLTIDEMSLLNWYRNLSIEDRDGFRWLLTTLAGVSIHRLVSIGFAARGLSTLSDQGLRELTEAFLD